MKVRRMVFSVLVFLAMTSAPLWAAQGATPQEVIQLHSEIKKNVDEVVSASKDFIDKGTKWAEKAKSWSGKFNVIAAELEDIYNTKFDKASRDLAVVSLLKNYEDAEAIGPLEIRLKDEFAKNQNLGEALATVKYYKALVEDRAAQLDNKVGELASKVGITEKTLKSASEYLGAAKTASKVYDALKPDADNAYRGLESIATILKEGAKYFPPPLDRAVGAYAQVATGFVSALKGLDRQIQSNAYQGALTTGAAFVSAWRARFNDAPPAGIMKLAELAEVEPSEVYVDMVESGQPVYSLEKGQIQEFGANYRAALLTYEHYLKILPLIREKTGTQVKVPLARFRLACQAARFREDLNRAVELAQKDLRDSPGGLSFLNSFTSEYFDENTAGKLKEGFAARKPERPAEEDKLPAGLRGEIGYSEGELGLVRGAGQEALQAVLSFKDDLDLKDLARKTAETARAALPKIAASIKKLDQLLADPQYAKASEELRGLQKRWWEASGFYHGLTKAESGLRAEDFPEEKNRVARFNYVLKGEFKGKIWQAAALPKAGELRTGLPAVPAEREGYSYDLKDLLLANNPARYKPLLAALDGRHPHPLANEEIDRLLKEIDGNLSGYATYKKSLDTWQKEQEAQYNELAEAARQKLGAAARVKQEIESQYSFKIVDPKLEASLFDAGIKGRLSDLAGQRSAVTNTYARYAGPLAEFLEKGGALRAALGKAREVNHSIAGELKTLEKERAAYSQKTSRYLYDLYYKKLSLIRQGLYVGIAESEKVLAEAREKLAGVSAKIGAWQARFAGLKQKIEATPFADDSVGSLATDKNAVMAWADLDYTGTEATLKQVEATVYDLYAGLEVRKGRDRAYQAKWAAEKQRRAEEEAKKPYAEIPLSSIRICSKALSDGKVALYQSDLLDGRLVIEGALANVRNGAVDRISYLINNVDYGRSVKGAAAWKIALLPDELPRYVRLNFAVFAQSKEFRSQPTEFVVEFNRPLGLADKEIAAPPDDARLKLRLAKARELLRDLATINNYFKLAISRNNLNLAKSLYLAALERADQSAANQAEAEALSADPRIKDSAAGVRNVVAEMESVLSAYVPDLANLKNISGNVGEGFNVEDVIAGKGPVSGGLAISHGTETLSSGSDFDFSLGQTTNTANSDLGVAGTSSFILRDPSKGVIQDAGSADFSTAPTLTAGSGAHFVTITAGNYYAVLTQEGHYAKIKAVSIGVDSVSIEWWYQPNGTSQF